ncbi:GPO family capsid scaffolding protein [Wohlfahrtiimonas larvae]|uniref:Phage capsid protein n=1 Tax=Wohlfahrtiimonas larvae TaxID=1157986 RepID=A0ABP9MXQ4_9GAMM
MNKKTKFTRIAVSGPTIDGRQITAQQIDEMAASYNPEVYTANIWIEHIRGIHPDSDFGSKGEVLALEARDHEINGQKQRALYAEMEVGTDLQNMNAKNQKKGFSIEITPNFAQTGKAYLRGLGATDSPASLGTQAMQFNIYARQNTDSIFSDVVEFDALEFAEEKNAQTFDAPDQKGFFKNMFAGFFAAHKEQVEPPKPVQPKQSDFNVSDLENVLTQFAEKQDEVIASLKAELKSQKDAFSALQAEFNVLKEEPKEKQQQKFVDGSGTTTELINY